MTTDFSLMIQVLRFIKRFFFRLLRMLKKKDQALMGA